jgi:hypothetical protein
MNQAQQLSPRLQKDYLLQAMMFVEKNGKALLRSGIKDGFSMYDYRLIEQYMIDNNKNLLTITLEEVVTILKNKGKVTTYVCHIEI